MSSNGEELPVADVESVRRITGTALLPRFNNAGGSSVNILGPPEQVVTLVHDSLNWLSVIRNLKPTDVIVLLTPVVIPVSHEPEDTTDPFECFGNAMRMHHHRIRHAPYTIRNGITSTHVGLIRRATVVIFVMSEAPRSGDQPQTHAALVTRKDLEHFYEDFPTIIQSRDYTKPTLEVTASFIFGKDGDAALPSRRIRQSNRPAPKLWSVEQWNEARDIDSVYDLWTQSMDVRFALHVTTLAALLRRPGYARHYVVRDTNGQLLGFCATFLSYVDQAGEKLIASLAILLVDLEHHDQGIGLSLHNYAIDHLKRTRGVGRLQLGSTFPRILYGPPFYMEFDQRWFSRRGWRLDREHPGQGQPVYDMLLEIEDWDHAVSDSTLSFRNCAQNDMVRVLDIVESEIAREHKMGWFDQYSKLIGDVNIKDVVVAVDEGSIVAVALTYTPSCCSPISLDIPWPGQIDDDVGGVTCICIPPTQRDAIMVQLLNACIQKLQEQGMKRMFLDAVSDNVDRFKQLGFKEWAGYRDVWKDI